MQYTGNVNKLIWYILLPLALLTYGAFIFWFNINHSGTATAAGQIICQNEEDELREKINA